MRRLAFLWLLLALFFSAPAWATVSTAQSQITIISNGTSNLYSFPFVGVAASDIALVQTSTSGTITTLPPSQYSVSINPPTTGSLWGTGGHITYPLSGSPVASGTQLTIMRVLPLLQTTAISNQGNFYPQAVERAIDTGVMQGQQISARTGSLRGTWVSGAYYNYGDIVQDGVSGNNSGNWYLAAFANTSSSWTTDLANGDWVLAVTAALSQSTPLPLAIANGGTGQITAPAALSALGGISLSANNVFTGSNGFTGGSITVPTRGGGDNTTNAASTAFVHGAVALLAPLASPNFTGTATATLFSGPTAGVTNGSSAASGQVGEYITSSLASGSAVSLTNNSPSNIVSITLSAGDWDIWSTGYFIGASSSTTRLLQASMSATSGTPSTTNGFLGSVGYADETVWVANNPITVPAGPMRVSLSGTATYYLVGLAQFTVSTCSAYGVISARRVR